VVIHGVAKEKRVMFAHKSVCRIVPVTALSMFVIGCATTESAAFRHMSAADHDAASRTPQSDPEIAAEHAAAAKRLRDAEQAVCVGVPEAERLQGPLAHPELIAHETVVRERLFPKGMLQTVGVTIDIRATPGATEQWLGRVTECNLAHYAALGWPQSDRSPLSVADASVTIRSTADGFRVTLTSKDLEVARALVAKGRDLTGGGSVQIASQ
jgi:hypothetical protein